MVLKGSQERVKTLLKDTITLLCKNGLEFKDNFTVEALIGVTLDNDEVMLISMNEIVKSDKAPAVTDEVSFQDLPIPDTTSEKSKRHGDRKRRRSASPAVDHPPIKLEPRSPTRDNFEQVNPKAEDLWGGGDPPSLSPSTLEETSAQSAIPDRQISNDQEGETSNDNSSQWMRGENLEPSQEQFEEELDEPEDDGEDIVFIKEEATERLQPSQEHSQRYPQQQLSQNYSQSQNMSRVRMSQEGSMVWSQTSQGSFRQRGFNQRVPRTSTVTSEGSEQMQLTGADLQNMQSPQQQQQGEHEHICCYCQKRCRTKAELRAHEAWHRGEYRYHCQHCNRGFMSTSHLRGHMSWHTGVNEFKCSICSEAFRYKYQLKKHFTLSHGASV